MSGSSKRRHSKWDHKDSEPLPENFYDRAHPRRHREPFSPVRGSHRHDSRSKESAMTLDREGNCPRMSPELDEWRPRHSSRSPRNGWGRSHRISKSRSRSRSQSPVHNFRREPNANDRSRSRSGASAPICRDFAAGRCRRGNSCHFLHQDAQLYDNRRPLECSPPDDWESRRRRNGSSRYSPDDTKDNAIRAEKSAHICNDFLKGRCRRGDSCRFVHDDTTADMFEKGPVEDVYRNRDHDHRSRDPYPDHDHRSRDPYTDHDHRSRDPYSDHDHRSRDPYPDHDRRSRDTYPDRSHECEPPRRGETPCKFFAAGNCRNGTRCRFSHQVQENFSPPERRSRDDRRDSDRKFEGGHGWDGPRWSDATNISTVPAVQGWEEDKNENKEVNTVRIQGDGRGPDHKYEGDRVWDGGPSWTDATTVPIATGLPGWEVDKDEITEVAKDVTKARAGDDSWSHDSLDIKPTWDTAASIDKSQVQDEEPLQWKIENKVPGMVLSVSRGVEIFSGDMEISPRDIKQQGVNSLTSQMPCISDISFPAVQQDSDGEASYEKHSPAGFQEHKVVFNDPFAEQNPGYKDTKPILCSGESRDVIGDLDGPDIIQNQPINVPQGQSIFQPDKSANVHPIPNINPPPRQSQLPALSHPPPGQSQLPALSHPPPGQSQLLVLSHPPPGQSQLPVLSHPPPGQSQLPALSLPPPGQSQLPVLSHPPPGQSQLPVLSHPPPGHSQRPVLSHPPRGERMQVSHNPSSFLDNEVADRSHVVSLSSSALAPGPATAHTSVSNEQLAQLSHLTASLTQLLENRQQLSQLSSAVTNLPNPAAPVPPVSAAMVQPNQVPEVLKQYDPACDSIEPKMPNLGDQLLPSVEQKSADNEIHHESGHVKQQVTSTKDEENGKEPPEGGIKAPEKEASQDVGGADDGAHDGKKLKDIKGIRPFKFALAEFVKELLKPSWKDGQVSKEAYKTIVKKVVDKVMETLGPQIPQTKEKIDLYLSCSKQKIDKLVQAYVGKHQKT